MLPTSWPATICCFDGFELFFDATEATENHLFNAMKSLEQSADIARCRDVRVTSNFRRQVVGLTLGFDRCI